MKKKIVEEKTKTKKNEEENRWRKTKTKMKNEILEEEKKIRISLEYYQNKGKKWFGLRKG